MCLVNAWLLYRRHCCQRRITKHKPLLAFRSEIAHGLLKAGKTTIRKRGRPSDDSVSTLKEATPKRTPLVPRPVDDVCHIVLGLRPVSREEEGDIVRGWLEREERRGYKVGQFWYLIAMDWWRSWTDYVTYRAGSESPMSTSTNGSSPGSNTGSLKRAGRLSGRRLQQQASCRRLCCVGQQFCGGDGNKSIGDRSTLGCTWLATTSPRSKPQENQFEPPSVTSSPSHSPRQPRKAVPSSCSLGPPPAPGPIDNSVLVATPACKVVTLTGEGGKLKRNLMLVRWRDFELVPDSLWKALFQWYGGAPALPRQPLKHGANFHCPTGHGGVPLDILHKLVESMPDRVAAVIATRVVPRGSKGAKTEFGDSFAKNSQQVELELYPLNLRLLRHQAQPARAPQTTWSGMVGGYGAAALSTTGYAYVSNLPTPPKRYLAYVAAFSRMATVKQVYDFLCARLRIRPEDMRLWHYRDENNMLLIEDEEPTLEDLGIMDEDQLLIEVRNKDLTWPEEMGSLAIPMQDKRKQIPTEKGATGLNNLGNTCFMNAALQCVSNTRALTQYFTGNMHLYELNRNNPLGMKGHIAKRYGDLIHDIWSGTAKTIAPLKLRVGYVFQLFYF
ncbi:hypothetical protein ANN_07107 [Periplaneta americana]|uniref:ubiquitinyl hydrolase 1 n=1 Tax=Periplaneta americana TaxID=6978 RepID=A0ABQ8TG27_PERAM|nr:hypothetical protein ANN_07107 [Periplaneta americana]